MMSDGELEEHAGHYRRLLAGRRDAPPPDRHRRTPAHPGAPRRTPAPPADRGAPVSSSAQGAGQDHVDGRPRPSRVRPARRRRTGGRGSRRRRCRQRRDHHLGIDALTQLAALAGGGDDLQQQLAPRQDGA